MAKRSAGLMMFRRGGEGLEVFLVHPGGPFWARRDAGAWTIPKGEIEPGQEPLDVARREFAEETGRPVDQCRRTGSFIPLGSVAQPGGKQIEAWAFEGDWPDGEPLQSNLFALEWPPGSGRVREFPEVDRGAFFGESEARVKLHPAQCALIDRLSRHLAPAG